jgi:glycosyltransferase involved in cell wall biosynthesis
MQASRPVRPKTHSGESAEPHARRPHGSPNPRESGPPAPHVLFILNSLGQGGAEKQTLTLLNDIDTQRIRPSLAYLKRVEDFRPQLRAERLEHVICCDVEAGIDLSCARRLAGFVKRNDVQAIVCTNVYATVYGYLARAISRRNIRLVSVYHTTLLRTRKETLQMLLYRRLLRRFDALVFVCEAQRAYWEERGLRARRNEVIHNGIDVEHFTDRYPPDQKLALRRGAGFSADDYVIGLCSGLRPEKAHGDLLEALARMRAQGAPAKALFIGDGQERASIERRIRELQLEGQVFITGLQPDVRPWIACADVMTLVSHSVETFSLAALESMALGKPLVMTRIGGASEQVVPGETGFLYAPGDIDNLVSHLITLKSPFLRATFGDAARRRVRERYTVGTMCSRFESLLTELAAPLAGANPRESSQASRVR